MGLYTGHDVCTFHAELRVIPELGVMPQKRFWSGQIIAAGDSGPGQALPAGAAPAG